MNKKLISVILAMAMSISTITGVFAAETENRGTAKTTVTMQIGNPVMTINGSEQNIDENGTVPVVTDDRTLLPVRAFVEGIGGSVNWDENSQTATLKYGENEIKLTIGSKSAYLNGNEKTLDVTPVIINGRTMLPIRFIAENFGYTVIWNDSTETVTIINADKIENVFAKGDVNPASPKFTGVSYMNWLTNYNEETKIPAFGQVTFEPCTRTDWHYHDGGQILLVTEGVGVFEMKGEPARLMQAGDVILIPPGKKHIHSAIDDSEFAHIAIGVNPNVGTTNWLDKVTDDEYYAAVKTARENGTIREKSDTMFPKGEEFAADGYSGKIYKNVLVENESVYNCPEVDFYTMESGSRTAWHSHEGGQFIIVTNGTGLYREENGDIRVVKAGDVIETKPGVRHWHGAASEQFSYIAVNGNPGHDKITWDKAVTDEEYNSVKAGGNTAVVDTDSGTVQGYVKDGTYTYHGIPYTETDERFVPAHKVSSWNGTKTAYSYGAIAPQSGGNNLPAMDENCQNLNIWTQGINDSKKRPVMVWLHGGGFSTGSSIESPAYDGENLSKKGDVVVVSINHRLNSLGHLDLSAYGDKYKFSANVGITDIIDALEWIKENISAFGGDPENVTVFGESGGGAKVLALMTSPYAKGLFQKEKYGDKGQAVLDAFKKAYPNESETSALYVDNTLIRLPILKLTAHKADQNGAPVYSYVFTFGTSYHTAEIPFVFNNIDKVTVSGDRADAEKLSDLMSSAWINFARSGNPNGDGIPTWEPYTREKGAAMIFDNESYQTENHDKELMKLLAPDYDY